VVQKNPLFGQKVNYVGATERFFDGWVEDFAYAFLEFKRSYSSSCLDRTASMFHPLPQGVTALSVG
jgi:hypothetical protein